MQSAGTPGVENHMDAPRGCRRMNIDALDSEADLFVFADRSSMNIGYGVILRISARARFLGEMRLLVL